MEYQLCTRIPLNCVSIGIEHNGDIIMAAFTIRTWMNYFLQKKAKGPH
jgi:hypothetical protein